MQQSKRVFRLYIWRNQGSVCIVDAVAIKGVEMGGSIILRGWDRVGVQQIFGAGLPSLLLIHPSSYCSTLSSAAWFTQFIIDPGGDRVAGSG